MKKLVLPVLALAFLAGRGDTVAAPVISEPVSVSRACRGFDYAGVIKHLRAYATSCRTGRRVARGWTSRDRCFVIMFGSSRSCAVGSWRCRARSPGSFTEDQRVRCRSRSRLVTFIHGY